MDEELCHFCAGTQEVCHSDDEGRVYDEACFCRDGFQKPTYVSSSPENLFAGLHGDALIKAMVSAAMKAKSL